MGRKFLESFKVSLALPEKWFCICWPICHYKNLNQYSLAHKIQFRLLIDFKTKKTYRKLKYSGKVFGKFQGLLHFSKKWSCICRPIFAFLSLVPIVNRSEVSSLAFWQTNIRRSNFTFFSLVLIFSPFEDWI